MPNVETITVILPSPTRTTITVVLPAPIVVSVAAFTNVVTTGLKLPLTLAGMRITADGRFQLFNPDQNKYHTISVAGGVGEEYMEIAAGEA